MRRETERIDLDQVRDLAGEHRPKLLIAGGSAFPRAIDFKPFREIADEVGRLLMADIAHPAGLVAAGLHPSPGPVRRLRHHHHAQDAARPARRHGHVPRRATPQALDKAVMPGMQGGPLMHVIAAKAVGVPRGADAGVARLPAADRRPTPRRWPRRSCGRGYRLVTGGTDTHLCWSTSRRRGITGKDAQEALDRAWITVNKNTIPFETQEPDGHERDPHRHAGGHHARHEGARDGRDRRAHRPRAQRRSATPRSRPRCGRRCRS